MGQFEKLQKRILEIPKDLTYDELKSYLLGFGFVEQNKGRTSGSRVRFYRQKDETVILLHKPHPQNIVKTYTIKDVIKCLKEKGDIL